LGLIGPNFQEPGRLDLGFFILPSKNFIRLILILLKGKVFSKGLGIKFLGRIFRKKIFIGLGFYIGIYFLLI